MRKSLIPLHLAAFLAFGPVLGAAPIVGLTTGNQILRFDSATPGSTSSATTVSGLLSGHNLVGIDFRPIDGALVGVSRNSSGQAQAYTIDQNTGAATAIGTLFSVLPGSTFGLDFNPVPNALRIVTDGEANLRITAGGGGVVNTDMAVTRGPGALDPDLRIVAAAYSNNNPGGLGGATTLFVIDAFTGSLYNQGALNFNSSQQAASVGPNGGQLSLIGSLNLGTNLSDNIGFDINNQGSAFVSVVTGAGNQFYTIDTNTATLGLLGTIGGQAVIRDIAAAPVPEPSTMFVAGLGLVGLAYLRRKR